jgi:guanyl-specific ribonuclease Sa
MERTLITSTALTSAGYDDKAQVLEVEFAHGGVYRYLGVPRGVYDGLLSAESRGAYFDEHVKKPGYAFERVT